MSRNGYNKEMSDNALQRNDDIAPPPSDLIPAGILPITAEKFDQIKVLVDGLISEAEAKPKLDAMTYSGLLIRGKSTAHVSFRNPEGEHEIWLVDNKELNELSAYLGENAGVRRLLYHIFQQTDTRLDAGEEREAPKELTAQAGEFESAIRAKYPGVVRYDYGRAVQHARELGAEILSENPLHIGPEAVESADFYIKYAAEEMLRRRLEAAHGQSADSGEVASGMNGIDGQRPWTKTISPRTGRVKGIKS